MDIARLLEQLIPGYQIVESILMDLPAPDQPASDIDDAARALKDALYYHGATLGAIRRLLIGEHSPAVLTCLATASQSLVKSQTQVRPHLERLIHAAPPSSRGAVTNVAQMITAADTLLAQVTHAIQGLVGPQAWESARSRLQESTK